MSNNEPEQVSRTDCTPWRHADTLRHYYQECGYSLLETAEVLGCTEGTVSKWCDRLDVETRSVTEARTQNTPTQLTDKEELRRLYIEEGLNTYEIAERVGYTGKGVHNWLVRHGIDTRPSYGLSERVDRVCENCGKTFEVKQSRKNKAKYCTRECYYEAQEMPTGPEHWSWKDTPEHRPSGTEWRNLQNKIRERDDHTCRVCGIHESDMKRRLDVHHLDRVRDQDDPRAAVNVDESRLVALCRSCHRRVERYAPLLPPSLD